MSGGVSSEAPKDIPQENPIPPNKPRFFLLTLRHYTCLTIAIFLSSIEAVSFQDMAFAIFSISYTIILSKVAFPLINSTPTRRVIKKDSKWLTSYAKVSAIIGLLLPIGYIFEGILEGDKEGIKFAAPHLFLTCCQVFLEGIFFSSQFSLPIGAFVPVFYNTRRIFTLVDWVRDEFGKEGNMCSLWRLHVGRGIAVANLGFWCFNLFGFLLPVFLPLVFKQYHGYKAKD
ncbi:hypothetical protein AMTRI_Chr07g30150 [Amborella trichopoda]